MAAAVFSRFPDLGPRFPRGGCPDGGMGPVNTASANHSGRARRAGCGAAGAGNICPVGRQLPINRDLGPGCRVRSRNAGVMSHANHQETLRPRRSNARRSSRQSSLTSVHLMLPAMTAFSGSAWKLVTRERSREAGSSFPGKRPRRRRSLVTRSSAKARPAPSEGLSVCDSAFSSTERQLCTRARPIPVQPHCFPVSCQKFPVPIVREFAS